MSERAIITGYALADMDERRKLEAEVERLRGLLKDADERASRIEDRVADLNRYGGAGPGFGGICQRHDGRYVLLEDVLAVARALQSGEGGKG